MGTLTARLSTVDLIRKQVEIKTDKTNVVVGEDIKFTIYIRNKNGQNVLGQLASITDTSNVGWVGYGSCYYYVRVFGSLKAKNNPAWVAESDGTYTGVFTTLAAGTAYASVDDSYMNHLNNAVCRRNNSPTVNVKDGG